MPRAAGSGPGAQYGPINGDPELRSAYAADLSRLYEGRIEAADVAITAGCNLAFFAAMMLVARHGDAVLLPTPWYFNHQMSLNMLGIEPRPLPCRPEAGFVPDVADAERLIDERVRAIVLVTSEQPDRSRLSGACGRGFRGIVPERGYSPRPGRDLPGFSAGTA